MIEFAIGTQLPSQTLPGAPAMVLKQYRTLNIEPSAETALTVERRRLLHGIAADEEVLGLYVDSYLIECNGDAGVVLERVRQVMLIVNEQGLAGPWLSDKEWYEILPDWFVDGCAPERTKDERERDRQRWLTMTRHEQVDHARSDRWSLSSFASWMDPEARLNPRQHMWVWWDASLKDDDTILLMFDRMGDPLQGEPPGMRSLILVSGAEDMDESGNPDDWLSYRD